MEKVLNIYQRMNAVMKEVTYIKKRERKQGMQYNFVSHDDVSSLMHMPLANHGIMPIPHVISYVITENKHSIQLTVDFINIDKPDEKITVEGWGYALDTQDKGYGKAMSYAYKYILLKTFVLESGDEDEVDAYQDKKEEPKKKAEPIKPKVAIEPESPTLNKGQIDNIKLLIKDLPEMRGEILKFTQQDLIADIPQTQYNDVIKLITHALKREGAA